MIVCIRCASYTNKSPYVNSISIIMKPVPKIPDIQPGFFVLVIIKNTNLQTEKAIDDVGIPWSYLSFTKIHNILYMNSIPIKEGSLLKK